MLVLKMVAHHLASSIMADYAEKSPHNEDKVIFNGDEDRATVNGSGISMSRKTPTISVFDESSTKSRDNAITNIEDGANGNLENYVNTTADNSTSTKAKDNEGS